MRSDFAQQVYDTLCGNLNEEAQVPGVEDLFTEGSACAVAYCRMLDAKERVCERLQQHNEDPDIEIIIDELLRICRIVGLKMFEYGSNAIPKGSSESTLL